MSARRIGMTSIHQIAIEVNMNKTKQIIIVVAVFVLALASVGTIIGLVVSTGQMGDYSDGFNYTLSGSRATITGYSGDDTDVVIPDKIRGNRVVAVANGAFDKKASSIKSIVFNSTYSGFELGEEVFKELTALTKVVLPSGLKEIPAEAFYGCKSLKEVYIPSGLTSIGEEAFYNCTALKFSYSSQNYDENISEEVFYLPESLLEIGDSAFYGCTSLAGVNIAKNLEKIGDNAFYGCTRLSNLQVEDGSELTTIGESAFYGAILKSSESSPLEFPNLKVISAKAFSNVKTNFSYFKISASVTSIGENAFLNCTSLSKVTFADDIESISFGAGCFEDCTNLAYIKLPEVTTSIPERMFKGCSKLLYNDNFEIGEKVEAIGAGAFAIYTNSNSYSRNDIVVNEANTNFTIINLEKFKKNNTATDYTHGLLATADGSHIIAYFGTYDNDSENSQGKTFRFLDTDGNDIDGIVSIGDYAFAGVKFDSIKLRKTVKNLGSFVFFKSEVEYMYIESISWEWESDTFIKEEDGAPAVNVGILQSTATASEIDAFKELLADAVLSSGIATEPN